MTKFKWDEYLWAFSSVYTRFVHISKMHKYPEEIKFDENASGSLGPFIDMFNHQFGIL